MNLRKKDTRIQDGTSYHGFSPNSGKISVRKARMLHSVKSKHKETKATQTSAPTVKRVGNASKRMKKLSNNRRPVVSNKYVESEDEDEDDNDNIEDNNEDSENQEDEEGSGDTEDKEVHESEEDDRDDEDKEVEEDNEDGGDDEDDDGSEDKEGEEDKVDGEGEEDKVDGEGEEIENCEGVGEDNNNFAQGDMIFVEVEIENQYEEIFCKAINSIGGAVYLLNESSDKGLRWSQLVLIFDFSRKFVETVENFDKLLGARTRFILNNHWDKCRDLLSKKLSSLRNKLNKSCKSLLSAIGLTSLVKKKNINAFNSLFSKATNHDEERIWKLMTKDVRPSQVNISSLPYFICLYCYYRGSLLFTGASSLSLFIERLLKKICLEGIKRDILQEHLREKFIIYIWSISLTKATGNRLQPGISEQTQTIITQKYQEWDYDAFWHLDIIKFDANVLGKLKLKTKNNKKPSNKEAAPPLNPVFGVYAPGGYSI